MRTETNKILLYHEVAEELGCELSDVQEVMNAQFGALADHIRDQNEEDFKLNMIGKIRHRTTKKTRTR